MYTSILYFYKKLLGIITTELISPQNADGIIIASIVVVMFLGIYATCYKKYHKVE